MNQLLLTKKHMIGEPKEPKDEPKEPKTPEQSQKEINDLLIKTFIYA